MFASQASKSFIELGLQQDDDPLKYYKPLEIAFLEATTNFYREKSQRLMTELNVARTISFEQYIELINQTLNEEKERVATFFDESSVDAVIKICEESLIKNRMKIFHKAFKDYLMLENHGYLANIYKFISRFPDEIEEFHAIFRKHVELEGEDAVSRLDNVLTVDAKAYIEVLLSVYMKYEQLVKDKFDGNELFKQSLELASKFFINNNAVTLASGYQDRSAELMAKYCDVLLSKNSEFRFVEEELKQRMEHIMIIFKFLNDKDGFQKFYENITARRLILKLSVSDELEEKMILDMTDYFGEQDSHSLQKIIENIKASEDINQEFKALVEKEKQVKVMKNFSVMILADKHCEFQF